MRVIAGKARSLALRTVPGIETRPTTDRIKETLFNILQNDLYGIRFLDIFSGSGGIGIEALSRGAAEAVFIEQSKAAAQCIRDNLESTHLADGATVLMCDVFSAFARLEGQTPFSFIFMDPPYGRNLERRVLEYFALRKPSFVAPDTRIIVEADLATDFSYAEELGFPVFRVKKYKTNMHIFLRMQEQERI